MIKLLTSADNDAVEQPLDFLGDLVLEDRRLAAVNDAVADRLRVFNLLQEQPMLADARNAYDRQ